MALYVSIDAGYAITMTPSYYEFIEVVSGHKPIARPVKGLTIEFRNVSPGFLTDLLPLRRGEKRANGMLRSDEEAARLGIKEEELIRFLDDHPRNIGNDHPGGKRFARVPEATDDRPVPNLPEDSYIVKSGDGVKCTICDRQMGNRGLHMHLNSKKHKALLAEHEAKIMESIG